MRPNVWVGLDHASTSYRQLDVASMQVRGIYQEFSRLGAASATVSEVPFGVRRCSSMVELLLPKQTARVRFPSSAPHEKARLPGHFVFRPIGPVLRCSQKCSQSHSFRNSWPSSRYHQHPMLSYQNRVPVSASSCAGMGIDGSDLTGECYRCQRGWLERSGRSQMCAARQYRRVRRDRSLE